jgi:hypothetical protein
MQRPAIHMPSVLLRATAALARSCCLPPCRTLTGTLRQSNLRPWRKPILRRCFAAPTGPRRRSLPEVGRSPVARALQHRSLRA